MAVLAGYVVLPKLIPEGIDSHEAAGWISALSTTATWALAGIVLTGLFNVWRGAGPLDRLAGSVYGTTLLIKLALVLLAALLGAWNRFRVMPLLLPYLTAGAGALSDHKRSFVRILQVEAVVLSGVLVAAAFLSTSEPPDAAATTPQSKPSSEKA
jgi:putative copper resistance protein D